MITKPFGVTEVNVAVVGQGTWGMGESRRTEKDEIAALRLGIELGMTHIDTAEMYADGGSERVVGRAVEGRRAGVFITTRVWPDNASYAGTLKACSPPPVHRGGLRVDILCDGVIRAGDVIRRL